MDCSGSQAYKVCVNAAAAGACDERLEVPVGSWQVLTIEVYQRMRTKLTSLPTRVQMYMGGYCKGTSAEVWVDDVAFVVDSDAPAACPAISGELLASNCWRLSVCHRE